MADRMEHRFAGEQHDSPAKGSFWDRLNSRAKEKYEKMSTTARDWFGDVAGAPANWPSIEKTSKIVPLSTLEQAIEIRPDSLYVERERELRSGITALEARLEELKQRRKQDARDASAHAIEVLENKIAARREELEPRIAPQIAVFEEKRHQFDEVRQDIGHRAVKRIDAKLDEYRASVPQEVLSDVQRHRDRIDYLTRETSHEGRQRQEQITKADGTLALAFVLNGMYEEDQQFLGEDFNNDMMINGLLAVIDRYVKQGDPVNLKQIPLKYNLRGKVWELRRRFIEEKTKEKSPELKPDITTNLQEIGSVWYNIPGPDSKLFLLIQLRFTSAKEITLKEFGEILGNDYQQYKDHPDQLKNRLEGLEKQLAQLKKAA